MHERGSRHNATDVRNKKTGLGTFGPAPLRSACVLTHSSLEESSDLVARRLARRRRGACGSSDVELACEPASAVAPAFECEPEFEELEFAAAFEFDPDPAFEP